MRAITSNAYLMGKYSYYQKVIALLFAWKCLFPVIWSSCQQ